RDCSLVDLLRSTVLQPGNTAFCCPYPVGIACFRRSLNDQLVQQAACVLRVPATYRFSDAIFECSTITRLVNQIGSLGEVRDEFRTPAKGTCFLQRWARQNARILCTPAARIEKTACPVMMCLIASTYSTDGQRELARFSCVFIARPILPGD